MAKKIRSRTTPQNVPKVSVAPASPDGPNRKVRKEEARREREALKRKAARRKFYRWAVVGLVIVAVLATGSVLVLGNGKGGASSAGPTPGASTLAGLQTGPSPWNQGLDGLRERLVAIGVPFGPQETLAYHIHDHLEIFVNGDPVVVPANAGINTVTDETKFFLAALHTHDTSGIIHVESPDKRDYTLGQFFDVWGVRFSADCIGQYCTSGDQELRVFLDGKPYTKDPRGIVFKQHHEIVVTYGTKDQLPSPVPSDYSAGLSSTCAPSSC
jgi:hypothetical protein